MSGSLKNKRRACRAIGKALATDVKGCGELVYKRTYGLGHTCGCYRDFLNNTPEGKEKQRQKLPKCKCCGERFQPFNNNSLQKYCVENDECIKAQVEHAKEQEIKKAEKRKQEFRIEDMSLDKFRKEKIQPLINEIARLIDNNQNCICTDLPDGKMNGGHRHSTAHNRTITYNLHNIHNQSFHSNHHQSGDHIKYRSGLKRIYGVEYADYVDETLVQCPPLHLTKQDLVELRPKILKIRNRLKKLDMVYSPKQRIRLRNQINLEIGIYSEEYAVFK